MHNHFIDSQESFLNSHSKSFVHLHLHTQYSLLDGAIRLDDLFQKCNEYGMPAVASTDHGNMFGAIDFYTRALKAGVKPLIGSEIYFTPGSRFDRRVAGRRGKELASQDAEESKYQIHHLVLICKNLTGYQNLCQLLSKAYLEGFYYKPRVDLELLKQYGEGLVATTACLKGEVAYNFFTGQDERAHQAINKLHNVFKDDFYLEIQENGLEEQVLVNKKIIDYAQANSIPLVATNDCHYVEKSDAAAQEVLLCVQTGKTFQDEKRMKLTSQEFYIKSPELMRQAFDYMPEACDNTLRIADKCNLNLTWHDKDGKQIYHLPDYEIETKESPEDYFRRLSLEGLENRFQGPHFTNLLKEESWESEQKQVYYDRLQEELDIICDMGFPGYFLIVSDFIRWAKEKDIPVGPGRGSGAESLVAYALEITNINPIPYNLLFERFINPERISMPDFDVDFCQDRRGEVIDYVTKKYGEERVGQIITFGKLQAKAVIRDVSRVYGLPYKEADALSKLVPDELGITLQKAIDMEPELAELETNDPKIRQVLSISKRLEGLLRHASIHAAGVIITNEPLVKYCPLYKGREGEQVVQFDKDFSEMIGLVKFDFLGLKTLTVIQNAVNFIKRDHDPDFDIESINMEDPEVYKLIGEGDTTGVFQLESAGMKDLCKRIKPDTVDDITAINALYRPGPMGSGMHEEFIQIKHGKKHPSYMFPELKPVLQDTYGIIVYQEQVMNIARVIAGYSLGEADMLRRAMGKKKIKEMDRHREIFRKGAIDRGFNEKKSVEIFELMAKFAEYGFNKSHAVAYAVIAYQTAFLKRYYPASFYAALLGTEMGRTEKVTTIIDDAKDHDIDILPPDINESLWLFNVIDARIRFGMGAVKNVGKGAVEAIIREREENGPYVGFVDLCERVDLKAINKRVLEALIKVGAFDECESHNRKTLLDNLEMILSYAQKKQAEKASGQSNLFAFSTEEGEQEDKIVIDEKDDFDEDEKLNYEAELMGIYVSGHPLEKFKDVIKQLSSATINELHQMKGSDNRQVMVGGMLSHYKAFITKKGKKMAFATIEDLAGKMEAIVFPNTFEQYADQLIEREPLMFSGEVRLNEEPRKLIVSKIHRLADHTDQHVNAVRVNINSNQLNPYQLSEFKKVLSNYRGSVPVYLVIDTNDGKARMPLGDNFLIDPSPKAAAKINELFQNNAVSFIIDGKAISAQ